MASMTWRFMMAGLVIAVSLSGMTYAVVVLDPGYQAEVYATYSRTGLMSVHGMAFDSSGNLYVTHTESSTGAGNGSIYRIGTDGVSQLFAGGLYFPGNIVWGGGTAYGDNLYVADAYGRMGGSFGDVIRFDLSGNRAFFADLATQPYALGLDTRNGRMYGGTRGLDYIGLIGTNGSVSHFSDFPFNMSGGPTSIEFDYTESFGGGMFVSNDGTNTTYSGIFSLDSSGAATRFAPSIVTSFRLGFDETGLFDGSLFATGMTEFGSLWKMYEIDEDGKAVLFAQGSGGRHIGVFTFGPDGAMYITERSGDITTISRITPVPEPASILFISFGALLLRKRLEAR